jgi:putative endonuclease
MSRDHDYWVYIMTNRHHTVLYIGMTNDLRRRVGEHRSGGIPGFTKDYHLVALIYHSHFRDVRDAIARQKQMKKWSRVNKIELSDRMNPRWLDLGVDVLELS